jgi:3-methyladenine DNA glycosylase Mpg
MHLPQCFFARPAVQVAPALIVCLLVKRQEGGELLWGVVVETEAYSLEEQACHRYRRRSPAKTRWLVSLGVSIWLSSRCSVSAGCSVANEV